MNEEKLTYTRAIRSGILRASEMKQGESVAGTLKDLPANKFGSNNIVIEINTKQGPMKVEIWTCGNLAKFFKKDVDDGRYALGEKLIFTRKEDVNYKGIKLAQFDVRKAALKANTTPPTAAPISTPVQTITDNPELQKKIQELLAKQGKK